MRKWPRTTTVDDSWEPKEGVAISEGDPPFILFNLDGPTNAQGKETPPLVVNDEEDRQPTSNAAELLKLHHRFGHISFKRLQEMAKQGTVPTRLAKCPIPVCTACMFAKATKRKWRDKTKLAGDEVEKVSRPGQVVSVDQMVSPTPGLIAQMTGFLTNRHYKYATVYVDQYLRHGFVYLQKTASADETLKGKIAFEMHAQSHGVRVEHYHADNGIFKAHAWVDACKQAGQGLTFAAVGAHHQSSIAERRTASYRTWPAPC